MYNENDYMSFEEAPVMFSKCTNWKPRPFVPLLDFLDSIDNVKRPNFDEQAW